MRYTEKDLGCWIDGAYGIGSGMKKLCDMVSNGLVKSQSDQAISRVLDSGDPTRLSDDHGEFDRATELIQDNTESGLVWVWEVGDLVLMRELEAE